MLVSELHPAPSYRRPIARDRRAYRLSLSRVSIRPVLVITYRSSHPSSASSAYPTPSPPCFQTRPVFAPSCHPHFRLCRTTPSPVISSSIHRTVTLPSCLRVLTLSCPCIVLILDSFIPYRIPSPPSSLSLPVLSHRHPVLLRTCLSSYPARVCTILSSLPDLRMLPVLTHPVLSSYCPAFPAVSCSPSVSRVMSSSFPVILGASSSFLPCLLPVSCLILSSSS